MRQNNRSNMFQFHLFTDLILVYYGLHHLSPWNPDFGHFFLPLVSLNLASNTRSHQLLLWRLRGLVPAGGFGLCFCHHNWRAAAVERPTLGLCCNLKSLDSTAAGLFCLFCSLKKLYKMHIGLRLSEVRTSWNGIWWKSSSRCVWIFEGFRPFAKWHAVSLQFGLWQSRLTLIWSYCHWRSWEIVTFWRVSHCIAEEACWKSKFNLEYL